MYNRMKPKSTTSQRGASLVEFAIVAPVLAMMGLGTLQAGLLYHDKTILNYATYEAARVGATRHADHKAMRLELGIRLAPIIGGDGTIKKAVEAIVKTSVNVESPIGLNGAIAPPTKLVILSPNENSFANWGEPSVEHVNRHVIPNIHLRHQGNDVKGGLTLADANLLKIEVTHGMEMKVPLVGKLLSTIMAAVPRNPDDPNDPDGKKYLERQLHFLSGRFPVTSTATVRMQSAAWEDAITEARDKPYGEIVAKLEDIADDIEASVVAALNGECGEDGLGPDEPLLSSPLPVVASNPTTPSFSSLGGNGDFVGCSVDTLFPPQGGNEGEC